MRLVLDLGEGGDRLRLDGGDADDDRAELAVDQRADAVGGKAEGGVGDFGVDDLGARDEAEVDDARACPASASDLVEGLAAGERGGGFLGLLGRIEDDLLDLATLRRGEAGGDDAVV